MTVENTNPIQHFTANGETTVFAISFAVEGKDNIKVTVNGSVVSVNDYSYDALSKAVVFNAAPEDGAEVVVERVTSLDRSINYQTYDNSFRPETLNYDLDRIWHVLQEDKITDAEILARIKEEIEGRRTHDFNYDLLSQARDMQVFSALKQYLDTILASTNQNIFGGVTAGVVFALDKKSLQTHLEDIYFLINNSDLNAYTKIEADSLLAKKAEKTEVDAALIAINTTASRFYKNLTEANADISNILPNLNDSRKELVFIDREGYFYKASESDISLTKSEYDPIAYTNRAIPEFLGLEVQEGTNIFTPSKIKNGFYLNPLGLTASGENFAIYVQEAKGGDVFFVRSNDEDLSSSLRVATKDSLTPASNQTGSIIKPVFERQGWYRITVPASTTTQAIYLMIYSSVVPIVDFRETLQIQKDILDTGAPTDTSIAKLAGYSLEDSYARERLKILENGQGGTGGAQSNKGRLDGKKLAAFGDSITAGTQGSSYVEHLEDVLGVTVTNKGSSGATASRMFDIVFGGLSVPRRDTVTASTSWPLVDYNEFDVITIQIGTNNTETTLGALTDIPKTYLSDYADTLEYWALFPNNYLANIAACIELIKSKNANCEIYLITPPHRNHPNIADSYEKYLKHKAVLESLSNYYGIPLISTITDSGISHKEMRTGGLYSYDGTHFNPLGNELWGKSIAYKILSGS